MNVVDDDGDQDEEVFVDIVGIKTNELLVNSVHSEWVLPLMVNKCIVPCKLDMGAQDNVMSQYDLRHLKPVPKVHKTSVSLRGYDGGEIPVIGRCVAKVCHAFGWFTKEIKIVNKFNVRAIYFKPKIENLLLSHVKKHSFSFCNIKRKFVHFKPIVNLY